MLPAHVSCFVFISFMRRIGDKDSKWYWGGMGFKYGFHDSEIYPVNLVDLAPRACMYND